MSRVLRDGINSVGYVDWDRRDFHGYETPKGVTYNSYLVRDEKTALIDTVKAEYSDALLENIAKLTPLDKIDYVICNHGEPDHSGAMSDIMKALPNASLVCNQRCGLSLARYHDTSGWNIVHVGTDDKISLGKHTLEFIDTPMVHWPDSMFTYIPEEKILFSMDAFGQHYATDKLYDDEVPLDILMYEAKAYYASIVMPFGQQVLKVLSAAGNYDISTIAPAHGLIWRSNVTKILQAYKKWACLTPDAKVVVIYDTMWESTHMMAAAIADAAIGDDVDVKLLHLGNIGLMELAAEIIDAAVVCIGTPTLNQGMLPSVAGALTFLKGLKPAGKAGFAFGSHGWGPWGVNEVNEWIEGVNWEILNKPIKAQYRPDKEVLEICRAAGEAAARKAVSIASGKAS